MSSKRRRAAARANGKKSHGPVTPEGKARSSANAVRHGLASADRVAFTVCLNNENRTEFTNLHEALIAEHAPETTTALLVVEEMAVCRWRLQRAWVMETALIDNQMDHMMDEVERTYQSTTQATPASLAFRRLAETSPALPTLLRYETRLSRQFDRCLKQLNALRSIEKVKIQKEPNPTTGHYENAPKLPEPEPAVAPVQPASSSERESQLAPFEPAPEMDGLCRSVRRRDLEPVSGVPPSPPQTA